MTYFVLNNAEQVDVTAPEAERLIRNGLCYRPDPDNESCLTTPWNISLDEVEATLAIWRRGNR